jgi:hypothetical protein
VKGILFSPLRHSCRAESDVACFLPIFARKIIFARKNPTGNIKCVFRPDLCYSDSLYSVFSSKYCSASKTGRISPYREAIPLLKKQQKSDKRNL